MDLLPVGTIVEFEQRFDPPGSDRVLGTVIGYGVDHQTGNTPRTVYLIRLDRGGYLARNMYISAVIAHPDSVHALNRRESK
jgi:hypothetical protein